jgi:SAM-dependent methyltransferase
LTSEPVGPEGGHLNYYLQHGISPVRYRMDEAGAHFDRRDSLYRSLGLPPVAFKGADVLEVAPGSGQNSLFAATCGPATLTLVEPNPVGRRDIEASYAGLRVPHTKPCLIATKLQDFNPGRRFDVVICENWLGALPHEVELIKKLASLLAPGGVMVLTVVPLSGFFPNIMRKLLALRILPADLGFEEKSDALVEVFGPHLATIPNMTRSHRDWVHDCMVNPHYLNVGLPLGTVLSAVGSELEALATFPRFSTDWRWFKGLTGADRRFNEELLAAEAANLPTFVDYRKTYPVQPADTNRDLNARFLSLHALAIDWQRAHEAGQTVRMVELGAEIAVLVGAIERRLAEIDPDLGEAVAELGEVWSKVNPTAADVRDMRRFGAMFGRETVYLSLTRPRTI